MKCEVSPFSFNVISNNKDKLYEVIWNGDKDIKKAFKCSCRWCLEFGLDKETHELVSPCKHMISVCIWLAEKKVFNLETRKAFQSWIEEVSE